MATINTRLKLKYDSYEQWMEHDPVLLAGEVAFAYVTVKQDGTVQEVPSVLMKVGDGEKKYSELDYVYAKAADVLAACKTEAGLKAFVDNVIANSGIATDEAMTALAGRVTTAEGKITALETKVGDKAVATQISEAIAALDLANTYEAKGEAAKVQTALDTYKTANDAQVAANKTAIEAEAATARAAEKANADAITAIKDGTTIDSFADVETALAGKEAAGAAAAAESAAKAYADGLASNYDAAGSAAAVDGKLTAEVERATAAEAKALADAKTYTDEEIKEWVGDSTVADQIAASAATKADLVHKHVKADITDFAHNHEMSEINGLSDEFAKYQLVGDYATKAEAQGYANAKDEAIAAALKAGQDAQKAADKAQEEVDALETLVGVIPEGATATDIVGYVQEKTTGIATNAALEELQGAVDALEEQVGEGVVTDRIAAAVDAEAKLRVAADEALEGRIATIEGDYLKAADKKALQDQIDLIMDNPDTENVINSINEFTQYITEHGEIAEGFRTDIDANAEDIEDLAGRMTTAEGNIALKAAQADLEALDGRVDTAEGEIDTLQSEMDAVEAKAAANETAIGELEELVGDKKVATQISEAIAAENLAQYATDEEVGAIDERLEAAEGKITTLEGEMDAVEGRATALETEITKKANDADLAAIAKSGNVDDLIQTAGTYVIFDCGTASVNI